MTVWTSEAADVFRDDPSPLPSRLIRCVLVGWVMTYIPILGFESELAYLDDGRRKKSTRKSTIISYRGKGSGPPCPHCKRPSYKCSRHPREWRCNKCLTSFHYPLLKFRGNNLIGLRFGQWSVICLSSSDNRNKLLWQCICDCGNTSIVRGDKLTGARSTKCKACAARSNHKIRGHHGYFSRAPE